MKWGCLGFVFFCGCMSLTGLDYYQDFTSKARARGCVSNQYSIDKYVGVWESQNIAIPVKQDLWLELDSMGTITRVAPAMADVMKDIDARSRLQSGSKVLFDYTKDRNVFRCPQRWVTVRDERLTSHPESHYRWTSSREPNELLDGKRRGTICLFHQEVGPRDEPDLHHRPYVERR